MEGYMMLSKLIAQLYKGYKKFGDMPVMIEVRDPDADDNSFIFTKVSGIKKLIINPPTEDGEKEVVCVIRNCSKEGIEKVVYLECNDD